MLATHRNFNHPPLPLGAFGIGAAALAGVDVAASIQSLHTSMPLMIPVAKTLIAFPLTYHYIAGLRHLYWDSTAEGLDLKSVDASSKVVVASSVLVTLGLVAYSC